MIDFDAIMAKHDELRRKNRAAETLRERATDIAVHITDMPRGGGGNQQEKVRIELVAAQEAAMETQRELKEMLQPLRAKMKKLTKWQHKDVIRKRYIEGKTIESVADEIGYSWSQVNRHLNDAKEIMNRL